MFLAVLIASIAFTASAQPRFHGLLYKPYGVVRARLIRLGYFPLAQRHMFDNNPCNVVDHICERWPEVADYFNGYDKFMFVFADRTRGSVGRRRRPLIVMADPSAFEVSVIRFANEEDRDEFKFLAIETRDALKHGDPTWEAWQAKLHPGGGAKAPH